MNEQVIESNLRHSHTLAVPGPLLVSRGVVSECNTLEWLNNASF
jgi:hypothetical protein